MGSISYTLVSKKHVCVVDILAKGSDLLLFMPREEVVLLFEQFAPSAF
jgi:hypothetical protein